MLFDFIRLIAVDPHPKRLAKGGGKQKTHRCSAVGSRKCGEVILFLKPIRLCSL